jgi:tRNA A-37 threonylcarbamoyl transferase component Bud32
MDQALNSPKCPQCGTPLAADLPEGLCPLCLLGLNLASATELPGDAADLSATRLIRPQPSPTDIARHFPHLEILECLGRGGMGVVYKARQPKLNRLVALKLLAPEKERDPKFAERFAREAQALARLNHPNIVTVHDFGETRGQFYLLMEYVDGVSLRQMLHGGRIKPEEALAIVPKICEALQSAHQQGVVHRDIKPENILLDKEGRVKIADFGIAKLVGGERPPESLTQDQQVVGTPHYMAPEQVEKPQTVDHRADIYSLGVVFYEMLTGELPLGKFAPPSRKVEMDVRLDEVVLRTLEKEPERRYQQASQVKTDVEGIAGDPARKSSSATKPTDPFVMGRFSRPAILGAVWAAVFGLNWVWSYTPPGWLITQALRGSLGNWVAGLAQAPLAILAFAAPVGVTGLGWLAVREIRRSRGRLRGRALALADMVLVPVFLLDFWLLWLCRSVGSATSAGSASGAVVSSICGVVLGLALDTALVVWLWRRLQKPLPPLPVSPSGSEAAASPERSWRRLIWKPALRAVLIGTLQVCLLETILQAAVHHPESTGELWYMALLSSSLAAMVWAAWPLRRTRLSVAAVVGGSLALFVALLGFDAYYTLRVRPNLGLYEEDDWVSRQPGFQWGWRQSMGNALWSKPPAQPFAPAVETVLPLGEGQAAALLDLDTGRQESRAAFAAEDEAAVASAQAAKLDLAIMPGKNKVTVLGLGLRTAYVPVPNVVRPEALTSQAAVNFWLLDCKPAKAVADLQVGKEMTGTYVFQTREGGVGFLDLAGLSDNPRGVKMRYKLVSATAPAHLPR